MSTFNFRVIRLLDAGATDNAVIAKTVLDDILAEEESEVLLPLLTNEVSRIRRLRVLDLERQSVLSTQDLTDAAVTQSGFKASGTSAAGPTVTASKHRRNIRTDVGNPVANERLAFLAERFLVPGVGMVLWGEATEEQHQRRIESYDRQIEGREKSRERHERALRVLSKLGVETLNEAFAINPTEVEELA